MITDTTRAACGWKTFYDRTWSAVEAVAAGKSASNELHAAVADVLTRTPIDLPEKVLFDLRQQETAQLETHTIEHLETFPERLVHVMRVRIAEAMQKLQYTFPSMNLKVSKGRCSKITQNYVLLTRRTYKLLSALCRGDRLVVMRHACPIVATDITTDI